MKLSIVTTLYWSAPYIKEFHQRASIAARQLAGEDYEIIFVNDGSPDDALEIAIGLTVNDSHVVAVDLSRNFGHHRAMMTGLAQAKGERVFLLDGDLEEEPEWVTDFAEQMERQSCDVVYGVQQKRRGSLADQVSGSLYYRLFRLFTRLPQPDNIVTARLMTRRYVKALVEHQERELNIGGLWIITGFQQESRIVNKHSSSPTTYSFAKKLTHLINAVTSFSSLPLIFIFYTGLTISLTSFVYIFYLVIRYMFVAKPPDGYTSIIASIWMFSGMIIFFLGIQGIYISKIFMEVKQRPYTIIRAIHRSGEAENET